MGRVARAFAADLIHGHLLDAEDVALVAAQGVPLVMAIHNQRPGWPEGLARLKAGDTALLVACARAVESELIEGRSWRPAGRSCRGPRRSRRLAGRSYPGTRRCRRLAGQSCP